MRRLIYLAVALIVVSLTGCGSFKEISVNSANVEKISPYGLKGVDVALAVEVDNPAPQIRLSDMEAILKCSGKVLGKVVVDPFTMKGRSVEIYHLNARMNLDEDISLYDVLMLLDKKFIDNCTVDVTVKGKLRSGLSKTVTKKDLPVKKLLKYAENKNT